MFSFLCLWILASAESVIGSRADAEQIAIVDVNVVDVEAGTVLSGRTILLENGLIEAVLTSEEAKSKPPKAERTIAGTGKFVIPGLWDMHVHSGDETSFPLFLANGVTGVRVMWGNPSMGGYTTPHYALRKKVQEGKLLGPRLVVASNIMDGPNAIWPGSLAIKDEAQARDEVRKAKEKGADFIKVYSNLGETEYLAIADEAKKLGIPFAGHVPDLVSPSQASDLGQKTFEHLYQLPLGCSGKEAELLAQRKEGVRSAKSAAEHRALSRSQEAAILESYDQAKAEALFAKLKANQTYQCPTLTVLRAIGKLDDPAFTNDPRLKYMNPFVRISWSPKNDFRLKNMKPKDFERQRETFKKALELVAALNKAGVPILAGTDEMNPYCFPGFSLHDELALMVDAGLSSAEALRTATINPARFLGKQAQMGTVSPGKAGDLVLLDANPLEDVKNTTKIHAVAVRGKILDRAELDRMLAKVEATYRSKPKAPPVRVD